MRHNDVYALSQHNTVYNKTQVEMSFGLIFLSWESSCLRIFQHFKFNVIKQTLVAFIFASYRVNSLHTATYWLTPEHHTTLCKVQNLWLRMGTVFMP